MRQLFGAWLAGLPAAERAASLSGAGAATQAVFGPPRPGQDMAGDFAVLHDLYELTAAAGPLALLCDDLHWADEPSLRFLAYLLPRLDDLGVLVVATLRPGEAGTTARLLELITADDGCQVRGLAPLTATASEELLRELLPDGCEDDFVAACQRAAAGNPLLLRELACTVRSGDLAPTGANAARVAGLGADAVGRRIALLLDRLPPGRRRGVPAEQAAVHLLRVPPGGEPAAIATLRRAAGDARARGAPQAAWSYLEHCLAALDAEDARRVEVLTTAGTTAAHVDQAAAAGDNLAAHGFGNPACVPWRTRAAQSLHARGRSAQARALAEEELERARRWGAPRALGRALRVLGLLTGGEQGRELLRESVRVLRGSPALLEYAHSVHHLGAALRRAGTLTAARTHLREALDLAVTCGAHGLARAAEQELRAAGARPRRSRLLSGPPALTNAEHRVAALAAAGHPNRDIAQRLFVTPKTVEVHLTNVYRKLSINSRAHLGQALRQPPPG